MGEIKLPDIVSSVGDFLRTSADDSGSKAWFDLNLWNRQNYSILTPLYLIISLWLIYGIGLVAYRCM